MTTPIEHLPTEQNIDLIEGTATMGCSCGETMTVPFRISSLFADIFGDHVVASIPAPGTPGYSMPTTRGLDVVMTYLDESKKMTNTPESSS